MSKPVWTCDVCGVLEILICPRARCVRDVQVLCGLVNVCDMFWDFNLPKGKVCTRCSSPAGTCDVSGTFEILICLMARCVRDVQVLCGLVNVCNMFWDFNLPKRARCVWDVQVNVCTRQTPTCFESLICLRATCVLRYEMSKSCMDLWISVACLEIWFA